MKGGGLHARAGYMHCSIRFDVIIFENLQFIGNVVGFVFKHFYLFLVSLQNRESVFDLLQLVVHVR